MWTGFLAGAAVALMFGSFWFWMALFVAFVIITALEENEKGAWALFVLLCTVLLFSTSLPIFHFLLANPLRTFLLILGYFAVGSVWGFVKWFLFVTRELERYNEARAGVLEKYKVKSLTPEMARVLRDNITKREYGYQLIEVNPQVRKHKSDVLRWMTYWPFSAIWTLINDPVRRAFRWIYARLQRSMQAVSDRMFRGAADDLKLAEDGTVGTVQTGGASKQ